ncbi:PREDICTED: cell wall integrity and stress response component 4-like [Ceratosolen solmsi marchali]|uniref:Cell wall integrity and stress response component 4-like n=1 Tax=Ceratosolen solmsi marchali TaxID=326594 RepID=A0AAJ7DXW4_9HYME|nr:PREDICTED: cell wall integrity and stress response component 4-like [Ceratosolen solmsi marchali]XP_011500416.1 PREDICTED: cell wall integrity and stress response component 4-like [Ceratosolen solmsi marchali]
MRTYEFGCLLLAIFAAVWDTADSLCSLDKYAAALCHDLEDARYIDTYHLHALRAPSSSKILAPGNFNNLTSLRHLDLSNGNIVIIKSGSFAKLGSLQTLNLANNRISHLEAGAFDGLKRVYSLKLEGNAIRQLPSALISLKELRVLDISGNALNCNCASMKLRDALLARGIKIGKKTYCSEPSSVKRASIFKPETGLMCEFEKQDLVMQADQPIDDMVDGSGEVETEETISESDFAYDEREEDRTLLIESEEEAALESTLMPVTRTTARTTGSRSWTTSTTMAPRTLSIITTMASSTLSTSTTATPETSSITTTTSARSAYTDNVSVSTGPTKDDITFEDTEEPLRVESVTTSAPSGTDVKQDEAGPTSSGAAENTVSSYATSTSASTLDHVVPDEGSGESDDDGSGSEGSGIIARMPAIDFNETSRGAFDEDEAQASSSSTTTTTESSSWWGLGSIISNLNPWGSSDTTAAPSSTEKSAEDDLREEEFIQVTNDASTRESIDTVKHTVIPSATPNLPNIVPTDEGALDLTSQDVTSKNLEDNSVDTSPSQDNKKGIGSYIVLITLLVILAILLGFAIYKGDLCRKKRKRRDVERGTEMKDMQRTLLDQNVTQPKVQPINGNTMENVPLMNSASLPDEPKCNQKRYDVSPTSLASNGPNKTNGIAIEVNDPIKPSRKSLKQDIEAPLNGLNPPMEAIDAPTRTSLHSECNEIINALDYCEQPPLTPGAHRVKITMQDNPDSVPKTPILITRMKDGDKLIKAP